MSGSNSVAAWIIACAGALLSLSVAAESEKDAPASSEQPEVRTVTKVSAKTGPKADDRLTVLVDFNDAPEAKDWALKAADYAIEWYPKLCKLLESDGHETPKEVTLFFKPMDGVAHASGTTVTISSKWINDHPEDLGMVAHELVHVVQGYGDSKVPGWLTEGIADYVRYYVVEPDSDRRHFDPEQSNYDSGYQATAGLLNFVEKKRPGAVKKLNALIRERKYTPEAFKKLAGGEPESLWRQFKASLKKT